MALQDERKFDLESSYSHIETKTRDVPNLLNTESVMRENRRSLEKNNSVSMLTGPTMVNPRVKIPSEFRTLSLQITNWREGQGRTDYKAKKDITDLSGLEWHTLSIAEVCTRLGVSEKWGLDSPMVARRLAHHGKNVISPPPRNYWKKIFFYLFGGFGSLLFGSSVLCFISWRLLGDHQIANLSLGVVILIVILVQTGFNAWQDYSSGRVMASISSMLPTDILVTRNGSTFQLPAAELVPGDLVKITLGSKVPADIRLIYKSSDLKFDRSMLTGESNAIPAALDATDHNFMESRNIALQGTLCTSGNGIGICVGLGNGTVFGRIAEQAASERPARTTLETEVLRFVLIIAALALGIAAFIIILWAAWLRRDHPSFISVPGLLIDCVSVAVACLPAGLPACVTLSLTAVASAMRKSQVLCKSLAIVESLGAVNVIASDKTGTLTLNKMTAVSIAIGQTSYTVPEARRIVKKGREGAESICALAAIAGLCNDSDFENPDVDDAPELRKATGDTTDIGLLRFSEGITPLDNICPDWKEVGKLSFNSKNKFALKLFRPTFDVSSVYPTPLLSPDDFDQSDYLLLVKGAPDVLARRCSHFVDSEDTVAPLNEAKLASILAIQEEFASRGERVLLLAKKVISSTSLNKEVFSDSTQLKEHLFAMNVDLTIVGLVSLVDPPRDDTAETVRVCRRAGIRFMMVTGDFSVTAMAIARQVGIFTNPISAVKHIADLPRDMPLEDIPIFDDNKEPGDPVTSLVLSGPEMISMTESQWKQVLTFDEIVFARASPQQKLQIVRTFQAAECTVAVTGDGVNDAPALKQADVGVAVAGSSEVAMEAADLILLSNFSAIISGIEYGRLCFANLRKSVLYLLPAGSFSDLIPILLNVLFGIPQALSSMHMVIICVITDVLPALSLIYEKPESDLLLRKPRNRKTDRLAEPKLICHAYLFLGMLESLTSMASAFYFGFQRNGVPFSALWLGYGAYDIDPAVITELTYRAQSIYFFNLVIMQWFNLLATRTRRLSLFQQNPIGGPKTRNVYIFPAMLIALGFACLFSYIPWFHTVFLTRGVGPEFFFLPMAFGAAMLFMDETRKWWIRGHPKSTLARISW